MLLSTLAQTRCTPVSHATVCVRAIMNFRRWMCCSQGIEGAHARSKLFFVASNIFPHNAKLKTYLRDMEPVIEMKPDALIMADPGLIMMVREKWPEVNVHLSVQANAVNWADVKFWKKWA
jgi:putative protease